MKEAMRKSLVKDVDQLLAFLEEDQKEVSDLETLSNHVIEDVTFYQNYDAATLAILIYSVYKIHACIDSEKKKKLVITLRDARNALSMRKLGEYNSQLQKGFGIIKECNVQIKDHIADVLKLAKLSKGSHLLEQGMSMSRAAAVMGISLWEIKEHLQGSVKLDIHTESSPADTRLIKALSLFASQNSPVIFLDAGPVITLAMSGLIDVLARLKKFSGARFLITTTVHNELIERPSEIRRFAFESLQVRKLIREGIIEVYDKEIDQLAVKEITRLANSAYSISEGNLEILQAGEIETIVAAREFIEGNSYVPIAVDERTLRLLIEKSAGMKRLLEIRKRKTVKVNQDVVKEFLAKVGKPMIIRSAEMAACALHYGLLDDYLPSVSDRSLARQELYEAVLWSTKYNGSSVIEHEIQEMLGVLLSKE